MDTKAALCKMTLEDKIALCSGASFWETKSYENENPEFRMLMASSAGSPLRSMQISGGMKGGVLPGMLEMANGHFLKGIVKMMKG